MVALEVEFVKLSECVVSPGWRLTMAATNAPGIHYDLIGMGRMIIGDHPPVDLQPHTLIIVPAGQSFCIEVAVDKRHPATLRSEEHTSELQSLMRLSYADFCLQKQKTKQTRR